MEQGLTGAGLQQCQIRAGEGDRRRCGRKVTDGEGVDIDKLLAHMVHLKVVAGPKVHGRWQTKKVSGRRR
jgi:hypothetical protein